MESLICLLLYDGIADRVVIRCTNTVELSSLGAQNYETLRGGDEAHNKTRPLESPEPSIIP